MDFNVCRVNFEDYQISLQIFNDDVKGSIDLVLHYVYLFHSDRVVDVYVIVMNLDYTYHLVGRAVDLYVLVRNIEILWVYRGAEEKILGREIIIKKIIERVTILVMGHVRDLDLVEMVLFLRGFKV